MNSETPAGVVRAPLRFRKRDEVVLPRFDRATAAVFVVATLAIHLITNRRYGYFRDELYFLDCARHLSFGYADCAPLIAVYAKFGMLLGASLSALRFLPAVAAGATVLLAMLIARELGGGRYAQALAAFVTVCAPALLLMQTVMTMNAFEPVYWMGCVWMLCRIINGADRREWVWFGVFAGLGIENKHSTVFFLAALFAGVLLSDARRALRSQWAWIGVCIAALLAMPNFIWQVVNHFPTYELLRNVAKTHKNVDVSPLALFVHQVVYFNPLAFVVWGAGVVWCFTQRRWRVLGWTYVVLFVMMAALHAKDYYFFPVHPVVIAAGAVAWERWSERFAPVRLLLPTAIAAVTLFFLPFVLPVLSAAQFVAYEQRLHMAPPKEEVGHVGPLPQYYGDQFGWPELVAEVARDYDALPAAERAKTGIFANNYGEAGAINFLAPKYGLPKAYSAHQGHWLWGPPPAPVGTKGTNLIVLQDTPESLGRWCDGVEVLSEHHDKWGMGEENGPILLCRGLKVNLQDHWAGLKHWN